MAIIETLQDLDHARRRFGRFMIRWRKSAEWSGATAERWARECPELFPGGIRSRIARSQWSELENARVRSAQPSTFLQLEHLNAVLASGDRGAILNRRLADQVKAMRPVLHEDGRPWRAPDWFACYIGQLEAPHEWRPPEVDTDGVDPEETTTRLRGALLIRGADMGLSQSRVVARVLADMAPLSEAQQADVLAVAQGEVLDLHQLLPAAEVIEEWLSRPSSALPPVRVPER